MKKSGNKSCEMGGEICGQNIEKRRKNVNKNW